MYPRATSVDTSLTRIWCPTSSPRGLDASRSSAGGGAVGWAGAPGARREGDPPEFERDFKDDLHPASLTEIEAVLEPGLASARAEDRFQFERHGYFVADLQDSKAQQPVFNRTVTLRDTWSPPQQRGLQT